MSGTDQGSRVPPWAVSIGGLALAATIGIVYADMRGRLEGLEAAGRATSARVTSVETDAARRGAILDDLRSDVHDLRADVRAGFDATRASLAALSAQVTTATVKRAP